jgi:hypothetical protein
MNLAAGTQNRKPETIIVPQLAASSRFGGFKAEPEREVREQKVETNHAVEEMKRIWTERNDTYRIKPSATYAKVLDRIKTVAYSAKDVETFSIVLAGFQDEIDFHGKAGLILSALINNCEEERFVIHTAHLTMPIDYLGYRNKKDIVVDGDSGECVGYAMEGGIITIERDAGHTAGVDMTAGTIIVKGDAGWDVGAGMKGGSIIVKGDAKQNIGERMLGGSILIEGDSGERIGYNMKGGEIYLLGDHAGSSDHVLHGKIFHKGKLIWPKGGGSK